MSLFSINPLTLQGADLSTPAAFKVWQQQVAQIIYQLTQNVQQLVQNPVFLTGLLNGTALLQSSAFNHVNVTVANGATDCSNAQFITGSLSLTATSTMTLNNVADAAILDLRFTNGSGSTWTLKIAANKPGGGAYSMPALSALIGAETDMTATGLGIASGNTIYLRGVAQLTVGLIALGYV